MESTAIKIDDPVILSRTWVHEFNESRNTCGEFNRLYRDARKYSDKFFNYLRMTRETFDLLLEKLETHLHREDTNFRRPISSEERLVITLR